MSSDFCDALQKAEAEFELTCAAIVRQAMPTNWQAAMTALERRYPQRWARHERLDLKVDVEPRIKELAHQYGLTEEEALAEAQMVLANRAR
jgi:hypothetical protein